jgi:hypothetical protein
MIKPINWQDINIDKIIYSKIVKNGSRYKMNIGCDNNNNLLIISPYFKNTNETYQYLNNNNNLLQLKFGLDPYMGYIEKFHNIILDLEKNILNYIKQYYKNITLKSIFECDDIMKKNNDLFDIDDEIININIKLPYYNKKRLFKFFDKNNNILDNINIKLDYELKFLLDFSEIWIDVSRNRCGINCKLIQAKLYESIYDYDCLIDNVTSSFDNIMISKPVITIPNVPKINLNLNNTNITTNYQNNNTIVNNIKDNKPSVLSFVPNINMLLEAKKKLNKIDK